MWLTRCEFFRIELHNSRLRVTVREAWRNEPGSRLRLADLLVRGQYRTGVNLKKQKSLNDFLAAASAEQNSDWNCKSFSVAKERGDDDVAKPRIETRLA